MRKWFSSLFAAVLLASLVTVTAAWLYTPSRAVAERESYAALSAYINAGLTGDTHDLGSVHGLVIIYGKTSNGMFRVLPPHWPRFASTKMRWLASFRSLRSEGFESKFDLSAPYLLAKNIEPTESDISQADQRRAYGVITFSKVTLDHDATTATFYTEHLCGLCGEGKFIMMKKLDGKWIVTNEQSTWVS